MIKPNVFNEIVNKAIDNVKKKGNFGSIVNAAIQETKKEGNHTDDRVLILLTETNPHSGYGYEYYHESQPHTTDARLLFPMGTNEKGQNQFLVSFDPTDNDDPTHPDPGVPAGWDWKIYGEETETETEPEQAEAESEARPEQEAPAIVIVLTRLPQLPTQMVSKKDEPTEITGFTLVKMPQIPGIATEIEQYAIMIDQHQFSVQLRTS